MFNTRFAKSSDDEPEEDKTEEQSRPIKGGRLKIHRINCIRGCGYTCSMVEIVY